MQPSTLRKSRIREWDIDERPREKLLSKGPAALSNAELLAILIGSGTRGRNAVDIAREVLQLEDNNLIRLGNLSARQIRSKIKGIGMGKAAVLAAAMELGRRREKAELVIKPGFSRGKDAAAYFRKVLEPYKHEVFGVMFLSNACKLICFEILSEGGLTGTVADPRIIFKKALEVSAVNIIMGHNHPSGNHLPSTADKEITKRIRQGAGYLDIRLLDHVIVSDEGHFSFADSGLL